MTHRSDRSGSLTPTAAFLSSPPTAGRLASLANLVVLTLLAWPPAPSLAQEPPGEAQIRAAIVPELPAWWSVERVDVRASVNHGDAVEPRWQQRFVADAAPGEALYAPSPGGETVGAFRVLIPTRAATETQRLYGVAHSTLKLGEWAVEVTLENTVRGLGEPRSLFAGPVVVAGSTEAERAATSHVAARALAVTVAEGLARADVDADVLRQLAMESEAVLTAANRERLDALRTQYEAEREMVAAAGEAERTALEDAHRLRLETLKASLAGQSADTEARAFEAERTELVARNRERLDALRAQYEAEREVVAATGEADRAALEEAYRLRLESLEASLSELGDEISAMAATAESKQADFIAQNRDLLDALRAQYEADRMAVAAAGESERMALAEAHRLRLEALRTKLAEERAATEATATAAESERAELVAEIRDRLDTLQGLHRDEIAAVAAEGEAERAALEEKHRLYLETVNARLAKESADVETRTRAAAAERAHLVQEHREVLKALETENERARAAAAATPETLRALGEAEAKAAAVGTLASSLRTLADERKRAAEAEEEATAADLAIRTAWYTELLAGLGSSVAAKRQAALDQALASDDEGLRAMSFVLALVSGEEALRSRAIDSALVTPRTGH